MAQTLSPSTLFPLLLLLVGTVVIMQAPKWSDSAVIPERKFIVNLESINLTGIHCPLTLFKMWRYEARNLPSLNFNLDLMVLSTINDELPFGSTSKLTEWCDEGLKFYAHYNAQTAKNIEKHPNVFTTFIWYFKTKDGSFGTRKIRIEGSAEKLSEMESKSFFRSESVLNKIRVIVQSQIKDKRVTDSGKELKQKTQKLLDDYEKNPAAFMPNKPDTWGGYLIKPVVIEFSQETRNALRDTIRFMKSQSSHDGNIDLLPKGVKALNVNKKGWVYEQIIDV